jgi:hypothetical protein
MWNGKTCNRDLGAQYDIFVAQGCVPELGYVTEMQDVSNHISKQVKIYLRRS